MSAVAYLNTTSEIWSYCNCNLPAGA